MMTISTIFSHGKSSSAPVVFRRILKHARMVFQKTVKGTDVTNVRSQNKLTVHNGQPAAPKQPTGRLLHLYTCP